jgi:hypothetical protein
VPRPTIPFEGPALLRRALEPRCARATPRPGDSACWLRVETHQYVWTAYGHRRRTEPDFIVVAEDRDHRWSPQDIRTEGR